MVTAQWDIPNRILSSVAGRRQTWNVDVIWNAVVRALKRLVLGRYHGTTAIPRYRFLTVSRTNTVEFTVHFGIVVPQVTRFHRMVLAHDGQSGTAVRTN